MTEDLISNVFGEVVKGCTPEELRDKILTKMKEFADAQVDAPRELERKRVAMKLAAKQRL